MRWSANLLSIFTTVEKTTLRWTALYLIFVPQGKDNLPNVIAQIFIEEIGRK